MSNLNKEIKMGGKWLTINQVVNQCIKVFFSIILARILEPSDFGAFAKVISVIGFAEIFLKLGLSGAIIQDEKITRSQISSIFWFFLTLGILLAFLVYFTSPFIMAFYSDWSITELIEICAFNFFFVSVGIVPYTLLRKELKFKEIFYVGLFSTLLSGGVALISAMNKLGAYSLALQYISFNLFNTVFAFLYSQFSPSFSLHLKQVRSHMVFGAKVFFNDILGYIGRNADNFLIGRYQGDQALGYYNRAYALMFAPLLQVNQVFINLLFPSISKIKHVPGAVSILFIKMQKLVFVFVIPILVYAFFSAKDLIQTFLGEDWIPSAIIFQFLIWVGMVHSLTALNSSLYLGYDKMTTSIKIGLISKPILVIAIFILAQHGIVQVAAGVTVIMVVSSIVLYVNSLKMIELSILKNFLHLKDEFISVGILGLLFFILRVIELNTWIVNLIPLCIFYMLYYLFRPKIVKDIISVIKSK